MRSPRLAAAVGTALGVLLLSSGAATAGGPTSVLIVSPQHERTASLYTTDADYQLLADVLDQDPVAEDGAPIHANLGPGGNITVTWLVHDVQVWRVDRIRVEPDGELWIHTQVSFDPAFDSGEGVWHRSPRPDELLDVLGRLGVLEADPADPAGAVLDTPAPMAGSTTKSGAGSWTWPALAGGIVVGFLGDRLMRRRGGHEGRGGWELVDAPYHDDAAGSP